ncbi:MAG: YIP1 family protein [Gemmatimonadota bacterium]
MSRCERCGFETPLGIGSCPLCGSELRPASEGEARAKPAWEDPGVRFPRNLVATWRESLLRPGGFFAGLPGEASLARPALYFLLITVASAFVTLWWRALGVLPDGLFWLSPALGSGQPLVEFFLSPFVGLIGLAAWTLVVHVVLVLLVPDHRRIGATARVLCYSSGPGLLVVVPLLGQLIGAVWTLVLQIVGLREMHRTSTWRAATAALALPALFLGLVIGLVVLLNLLETSTGRLWWLG